MALGVAAALQRLKRKREMIIVGVDLIKEIREAIRTGVIEASVAFSTASVPNAVLESTLQVLRGEAVADGYPVKSAFVNRGKLDSWENRNPAE